LDKRGGGFGRPPLLTLEKDEIIIRMVQ